ncbi:uncharacterized protein LOC135192956 [Pogoniulus pusillus]|uniref:uncharacterized protein LOC135192956 n=1 Tax=Pogoniulus pusillus TaxID=488313 RepID=UPI0030B97823
MNVMVHVAQMLGVLSKSPEKNFQWTDVSPGPPYDDFLSLGGYCGTSICNAHSGFHAYNCSTGAYGATSVLFSNTEDIRKSNIPLLWNNKTAKALPPNMFLICGDRAWQGIPRNAYGGPCYLGRLSLFAPHHRDWLNITKLSGLVRREKRSISALGPDCKDDVELWSFTARVFASFFAPGVAAAQALRQIDKLACWSVKQANVTTDILQQLLVDQNSLRHALLQNRAAIDFLLLAQGHGCEDFEGMCCFNLSDHSESIHKKLTWLKEHTQKIKQETSPFDKWLQSLVGGLSPWLLSLIKEVLRLLGIVLLVLLIIRIAYSCILRGVEKATRAPILLAQKQNGGIVEEWLRENGHGEYMKLVGQQNEEIATC